MKQRLSKVITLCVAALSLLVVSMNANARAIRIDDEGGLGIWTDPTLTRSSASSEFVSDIGFTFNFFGTTTTSLTINSDGSVSFGDAVIAPFLDNTATNPFSYSTTQEQVVPGIPNAIRIQWGTVEDTADGPITTSDNLFQLAIFDLTNGLFAMEFNYGQITAGSDDSSIGFDNGAGTSFDLLAELGGIRNLGGPLPFDDYDGVGNDGFDFDNPLCPISGNILACNNYNAVTGDFGPLANLLPSDFFQYFQMEQNTGVDAQGRYFFLIDNPVTDPAPVPEPGTLWLLGIGFAGLALSRRRRRAGIHTP